MNLSYINPDEAPDNFYDEINPLKWSEYILRMVGHGVTDVLPYFIGGNVRGKD